MAMLVLLICGSSKNRCTRDDRRHPLRPFEKRRAQVDKHRQLVGAQLEPTPVRAGSSRREKIRRAYVRFSARSLSMQVERATARAGTPR